MGDGGLFFKFSTDRHGIPSGALHNIVLTLRNEKKLMNETYNGSMNRPNGVLWLGFLIKLHSEKKKNTTQDKMKYVDKKCIIQMFWVQKLCRRCVQKHLASLDRWMTIVNKGQQWQQSIFIERPHYSLCRWVISSFWFIGHVGQYRRSWAAQLYSKASASFHTGTI